MTSDPSTSLCDNMDHTSDMAEDKKRWLCVPRREKKLQNTKQKIINVKVVMLLCFIWNNNNDILQTELYV